MTTSTRTADLSDLGRSLADALTFAVVATTEEDGSPQTSVVWIRRDGDDLLFSTVEGRRKHRNLVRTPRASVLMLDPEDGYRYVEVRGPVEITPDPTSALIDELCRKYNGRPWTVEPEHVHRVVVRVRPEKVVVYDD